TAIPCAPFFSFSCARTITSAEARAISTPLPTATFVTLLVKFITRSLGCGTDLQSTPQYRRAMHRRGNCGCPPPATQSPPSLASYSSSYARYYCHAPWCERWGTSQIKNGCSSRFVCFPEIRLRANSSAKWQCRFYQFDAESRSDFESFGDGD